MIDHILREDRNNDCNFATSWAVDDKRTKKRPNTTWRRTVKKERKEAGWSSWRKTRTVASDPEQWRTLAVKALCVERHEKDR